MKTITIDRAGRMVLPKRVRERLGLGPGDALDLEVLADGVILRPQRRAAAGLVRQEGRVTWGAPGGEATVEEFEEILQQTRRDREHRAAGFDEPAER